ncbi:uncharacterized protein LOC121837391 [Ixodes scapularis]|uniref:uncharacterized protein LOC121837391 n=1 Tax=Ixodes scapularis TaxID=6945 RepID=UPI001C388D51|nr:uncharacterized protein LOC121837391 [Ixodes scapularis]
MRATRVKVSRVYIISDQQDPEKVPPHKERKFIVFEGCLLERFRVCHTCFGPCRNTTAVSGTLLTITSTCTNEHKETWRSQPKVGNKAAGNPLICAAILFSGADVATTLRLLRSINISTISDRLYYYYQEGYLLSTVKQVYERRNTELLEGLRGKAIDLAGDGRCDSPGFSAKYCIYTFHEATTKKIIHMEQVQVGEVRTY